MPLQIKKAVKEGLYSRVALIGGAGCGKTYTALAIMAFLAKKFLVLDTEHGSASKYADLFNFDTIVPDSYSPQMYIDAILMAEREGYDGFIADSMTHGWIGKGGALDLVNAKSAKSGNSYTAWGAVTPLQNEMIDTILRCKMHFIGTLRSKMEYVQEKNKEGKTVIRKVGLQPVQREGLEFEFDIVADIDQEHILSVTKTRCPNLDGRSFQNAGEEFARIVSAWLSSSAPVQEAASGQLDPARFHDFLQAAGAQKKRIGEPAYYRVLGEFQITKSNQVDKNDMPKMKAIILAMKSLPDQGTVSHFNREYKMLASRYVDVGREAELVKLKDHFGLTDHLTPDADQLSADTRIDIISILHNGLQPPHQMLFHLQQPA